VDLIVIYYLQGAELPRSDLSNGAFAPPGRRNMLHGFPPRLSGDEEKRVVWLGSDQEPEDIVDLWLCP
jgi:hypothetical protein